MCTNARGFVQSLIVKQKTSNEVILTQPIKPFFLLQMYLRSSIAMYVIVVILLREDLISYVKISTFAMFVLKMQVLFLVYLHTKCHILISSSSLISDIRVKAK